MATITDQAGTLPAVTGTGGSGIYEQQLRRTIAANRAKSLGRLGFAGIRPQQFQGGTPSTRGRLAAKWVRVTAPYR